MAELPSWRRSHGVVVAVVLAAVLFPGRSSAQVHWDASAQVGAMKRFLASRPNSSPDAGFGPTAQLTGHVALLPLVHVGGYFGHDISPLASSDAAARQITFGGLRAKGMLPWIRGSARAWIFAGFGYAGVYAPSYGTNFTITDGAGVSERHRVRVEGSGGGFFDVPFGIGASYKLYKPWELCAELGGRVELAPSGSVYQPPGPRVTVPGLPGESATPAGLDQFAIGLTIGVLVDL